MEDVETSCPDYVYFFKGVKKSGKNNRSSICICILSKLSIKYMYFVKNIDQNENIYPNTPITPVKNFYTAELNSCNSSTQNQAWHVTSKLKSH